MNPNSVLFDLDGTLLDTAPDLVFALNEMRKTHGFDLLSAHDIRPFISLGSKAMVSFALNLEADHQDVMKKRALFLKLYEENIARETRLFEGIEALIQHLNEKRIPWGIVTNKLSAQTELLLKEMNALKPGCLVCGDTLTTCKPDPAPLLHACNLLKVNPRSCLYVGDALTDIQAAKRAGAKSLAATYGYIAADVDPLKWEADHYASHPDEILELFRTW